MTTFTLLGSGTSQGIPVIGCSCEACTSDDPRDVRLRCSGLVRGDSATIVIDVGPDFRQQMLMHDVTDVDAVFLTHEHNDHVIGLDDLRPFIFKRNAPMKIYAEQRVLDEIITRFAYAFEKKQYPGAPSFELLPIRPGDSIEIGDIEVKVLRSMHGSLPILSYFINRKLAYLTDANGIPKESHEIIENCRYLLIDMLRERHHHSHNDLDQAIAHALAIDAEQTYMIHMSHLLGPTARWEQKLPPDVFSSYDGMQFELDA